MEGLGQGGSSVWLWLSYYFLNYPALCKQHLWRTSWPTGSGALIVLSLPFHVISREALHKSVPWAGAQLSWERACLACAKARVQSAASRDPSKVAHVYHLSTWEAEAGESEVQNHYQLHSRHKGNLRYSRACLPLKRQINKQTNKNPLVLICLPST